MAKKLKDIIRINPEPAKGRFGVDPMDPWSTKANIAEDGSLGKYLLSRGINPKFVSTDTKISHAKSSAFLKWKQDHQFESVESLDEDALLDKFLMSRGINPKYVTKDMKISHSKSGEFIKWKRDHMFEELQTEETDKKDIVCFDIPLLIRVLEYTREDVKTDVELHNMVERLINMRETYPLTMKDYDAITSSMVKENHVAIAMGNMLDDEGSMVLSQLEQLERAIDMIRSHIGKDYEKQLPAWVQAKITLATDYADTVGNYITSKNEKVTEETEITEAKKPKLTALERWRKAAAEREKKYSQPATGDMKGAIDKLEKHLNKEEVEQIDEISKSTLSSYKDKSSASMKNAQANRDAAEPGKNMSKGFADLHAKSDKIVKNRVKGLIGYMQRKQGMKPTSEDTLDPLAATQSPNDCGTSPNDVAPKKQGLSKSARMIKALYKHHNMKEDMTDWEKEDKSVQTYGKKPKVMEPDEKKNLGEKKPDARIVMSGGTTMTGEKRDTVEIDPSMKNRPGPDTFGPSGKKASQQ
jgi:hypothetical protein